MSDEKKPVKIFLEAINHLKALKDSEKLKDSLVFAGWIASIIILAGLCWALTQPIRNRNLVRAVNEALEHSGDPRRLEGASLRGASLVNGSWFNLTEKSSNGGRVFVFSFIGDGTFFPCAAILNTQGKVEDFVFLDRYGEKMQERISPGILNIYARRIEEEAIK